MTPVRNGQEAVDAFTSSQEGEFDAILMDVNMPVMDGCAAASAIRAMNRPDACLLYTSPAVFCCGKINCSFFRGQAVDILFGVVQLSGLDLLEDGVDIAGKLLRIGGKFGAGIEQLALGIAQIIRTCLLYTSRCV